MQLDLQKMDLSPQAQSFYEEAPFVSSLNVDLGEADTLSCSSGDSGSSSKPSTPTSVLRGTNKQGMRHSHSPVSFSSSREGSSSGRIARSRSKDSLIFQSLSRSSSRDKGMHAMAVTHQEQLSSDCNSSDKEELRSFSPYSDGGVDERETRPLTLLEFKKRLVVEKRSKNQKSECTVDCLNGKMKASPVCCAVVAICCWLCYALFCCLLCE